MKEKLYGIIAISKGGNIRMKERLFKNYEEAEDYAEELTLLPYGTDNLEVVEVYYNITIN